LQKEQSEPRPTWQKISSEGLTFEVLWASKWHWLVVEDGKEDEKEHGRMPMEKKYVSSWYFLKEGSSTY